MKATLRNFLIFFGVLILLAAVWYFRNIVVYILVSGVLSIMGRPLVDLFCRIRIWKWKFPRVLAALFALIIIWGSILLFLYIFIPLVTKQINHFTGIDSEKIVRLIEGPLEKIEKLFVSLNPSISDTLSLKAYIASKVSEVLSIDMIQDFIGSIIDLLVVI